ncbi:MAG: hypothetical protein KAX28_09745 [Candidatus Marinimicrobia bacterium]|nr:hypothetical protein [Candidatus Neomarinimicrobiota bacterium]
MMSIFAAVNSRAGKLGLGFEFSWGPSFIPSGSFCDDGIDEYSYADEYLGKLKFEPGLDMTFR